LEERMQKYGNIYHLLLVVIFSSLLTSSCAKKEQTDSTVILVNDYTLSVNEFNELLNDSGIDKDDPVKRKSFLDNLITRKLILQEAQKAGLDKDKDFLQSVERFWEQSLLKVIIDKKIRESLSNIEVTEDDIANYYTDWKNKNPQNQKTIDQLREVIKRHLLNKKQTDLVDSWIESLKKEAVIKVDKKALGIK